MTYPGGSDPSLYSAYEAAWALREESGVVGEQVLLTSFAELAARKESLQSDADVRQLLLEAWKQGVPPRKLTRFATKHAAESAIGGLKEIVGIVKSRYPQWMALPDELGKISKGWLGSDAENVKLYDFDFRPGLNLENLHERCEPVEVNSKGFRKIPIWLDISSGEDTAVFVGAEVIGGAMVPDDLKARVKTSRRGKRKVPDGFVQLRAKETGELEFRKLRAHFPK